VPKDSAKMRIIKPKLKTVKKPRILGFFTNMTVKIDVKSVNRFQSISAGLLSGT